MRQSVALSFFTLLQALPLSTSVSGRRTIHGRYTRDIADYEVILPRKLKPSGAFHTFHLPHFYGDSVHQLRRKRKSSHIDDTVQYQLVINRRPVHVQLTPNLRFISSGLVIERRFAANLTNIQIKRPTRQLCHFSGVVKGEPEARVALSACDGLAGVIRFNNTSYFIEPLMDGVPQDSGEHLHAVHRRSFGGSGKEFCSVSHDDWWNSFGKEMYHMKKRAIKAQILQGTTINSQDKPSDDKTDRNDKVVPRYIKIMVVADKHLIDHHKNVNVEEYILILVNMMADLYHDQTIGELIDVVVVKIVLLHKQEDELDLQITANAEETLDKFCTWAVQQKPKSHHHPNQYDLSLLLTRIDLCATKSTAKCNLIGLAYRSAVCHPARACSINEDSGLSTAYVMSHETGHNMGCAHDTAEEGCTGVFEDGTNSLMGPYSTENVGGWSNCSRGYINALIRNNLGECLLDPPEDHNYKGYEMPPGAVYDSDQQCKFLYAQDFVFCNIRADQRCAKLWCKKKGSNQCLSRGSPPAEGTPCGDNMWCFRKECVRIGERPNAIDGQWGEWGPWSGCTRTCNGGVRHRERVCDNPPRSHGGEYCVGNKLGYEMCNTHACDTKALRFRHVQCKEMNSKVIFGKTWDWKPFDAPEKDANPCALWCVNENMQFIKFEQRVKDGTRCHPGSKNTCIHGFCVKVGCDWKINSDSVEDACGICDGEGTHCVVNKKSLNSTGDGYVKIADLPKNSSLIKVRELQPSVNMFVIARKNGRHCLNANHTESPLGEVIVGGVPGLFIKPENDREELHVTGPIKEDIQVLYDFIKMETPRVEVEWVTPSGKAEYTPKYHWEFVEWDDCSVDCGGGTQVSMPSCIESRDGRVKSSFCKQNCKPEAKTRQCNLQPCQARWKALPWSACSGCDGVPGERKRIIECVLENPIPGENDDIVVEDVMCSRLCNKPLAMETCTSLTPCFANLETTASKTKRLSNLIDQRFLNHVFEIGEANKILSSVIKHSINKTKRLPGNLETKTSRALYLKSMQQAVEEELVVDATDVKDVNLEVANLSRCNKGLMNLSDFVYEKMGDKFPSKTIKGKSKIFTGDEAKLQERKLVSETEGVTGNNTKTRNFGYNAGKPRYRENSLPGRSTTGLKMNRLKHRRKEKYK